jgi:long-chain acyl-CoA synthetase
MAPGDRVAILADNDARWCAAYLGILRIGAVAVPLDTAYNPEQIATVVRSSGARLVFADERHIDSARSGATDVDVAPLPDLAPGAPSAPAPGAPRAPSAPSAPAVILYTSGTTSVPKGVVLTHANLLAERTAVFGRLSVDERDAVLGVLPLFHALAQVANLLLPLSVGARVVFLETVNTHELLRALAERGVTVFCCVPQFFYLVHQRIRQEIDRTPAPLRLAARALAALNGWSRAAVGLNFGRVVFRRAHRALGPRMRVLVTGGARFDPAIGRDLYRLGFTIQQAYGLTESSGAATMAEAGDPEVASVGRPLPGVEVTVDAGEIAIRGPIVMAGYFNRPDETAQSLRGGWLRTGDLGSIDATGRVYVTGRIKEVIVLSSGKNIYPEEIEAHYERSPFIKELCVVGLSRPGEPAAERLHALVHPDLDVLRERRVVNMRELLRFEIEGLSVELPGHKRVLGYDITLDELPRTTTRKLKRFEVERELRARQERAAQEADRPSGEVAAWAARPDVARVLAVVREVVNPGVALYPDAHLELDLGLDSMERVELLMHVSQALGADLGEEAGQGIATLRDLVEGVRPSFYSGDPATPDLKVGPTPKNEGLTPPWHRLLDQAPADDPFLRELDKRKVVRSVAFFALMKLIYLAARLTCGFTVRGRRNLPVRGPYLVSPNHQSYIDSFLLVAALPFHVFRQLFFVGASEYFQTRFMQWIARMANVVPVDPDANLVRAMQAGAYGLRRGRVLVLFPEGERSIDGTVKAFRKGAAILSRHLGVPIVPAAIDGAWDVWARNRPPNWRSLAPWSRARMILEFGAPRPPSGENVAAETERLRETVLAMWQPLHAERLATGAATATSSVGL